MISQNVWNMSLLEHFFTVLSLCLQLQAWIRIHLKETSRIRIPVKVMRIHNTVYKNVQAPGKASSLQKCLQTMRVLSLSFLKCGISFYFVDLVVNFFVPCLFDWRSWGITPKKCDACFFATQRGDFHEDKTQVSFFYESYFLVMVAFTLLIWTRFLFYSLWKPADVCFRLWTDFSKLYACQKGYSEQKINLIGAVAVILRSDPYEKD